MHPQAKEDKEPKTVMNAERLQVERVDRSMKLSLQISPRVKIMSLVLMQTIIRVEKVRRLRLKMYMAMMMREKRIEILPTPRMT